MFTFRHFLTRMTEDRLLLMLILALLPLLLLSPAHSDPLAHLVDWSTLGALTGLMVLSRGLEDSGLLAWCGRRMLARVTRERTLAALLVLFSASLAALVTNDVALFIVVPLTVVLRHHGDIRVGRLVIFEALAVNAGSTLSPIGNPQNLYLWQSSSASFSDFGLAMLPLGLAQVLLLLAAVPLGFSGRALQLEDRSDRMALQRRLLWLSLGLYPPFLWLADLGWAPQAAGAIIALYLALYRRVLHGVDWPLLLVFLLMFVDLGLLARLPAMQQLAGLIDTIPGGLLSAAVLLSQLISNVPATLLLAQFNDDWRSLAWGVSVGGFGFALGSLANLIALRLARQPGLWREFHGWSLPALLLSLLLALGLRGLGA